MGLQRKRNLFIMIAVIAVIGYGVIYTRNNKVNVENVDTVVVANTPSAEVSPEVEEEEESSTIEPEEIETVLSNATIVVQPIDEYDGSGVYAYVQVSKEEMNGMNREQYHVLTDQISELEYEYFTIVLEDGTGMVFHPEYCYWAMYGELDESYYIKNVISYIDATADQVETVVVEEKSEEIQQFIYEMTSDFKELTGYAVSVSFLYDNIFEANLTLDIQSSEFSDVKHAVKELEQKLNTMPYQINCNVTFVDNGKHVMTMTFGDEYLQYTYIENGHKIQINSLD